MTDNELLKTADEIEKKRLEISDLISWLDALMRGELEEDDLDDDYIGVYKDIYTTKAFANYDAIQEFETILRQMKKLNKSLGEGIRSFMSTVNKYSDRFTESEVTNECNNRT